MGIELNGVANLKILVSEVEELASHGMEVMPEALHELTHKMNEQLVLLERYMLAYQQATDPNSMELVPQWHEIRANPEQYPTNSERFKKVRHE